MRYSIYILLLLTYSLLAIIIFFVIRTMRCESRPTTDPRTRE